LRLLRSLVVRNRCLLFAWFAYLAVALSQLSTLTPQLAAAPVIFTTNAIIAEANAAFDGQEIVIDGAVTVAIDGPHAFNSLLLTNGAVLTVSPCAATEAQKLNLTVPNPVVVSSAANFPPMSDREH